MLPNFQDFWANVFAPNVIISHETAAIPTSRTRNGFDLTKAHEMILTLAAGGAVLPFVHGGHSYCFGHVAATPLVIRFNQHMQTLCTTIGDHVAQIKDSETLLDHHLKHIAQTYQNNSNLAPKHPIVIP